MLTRDERKGGMQDQNRENTTTSKLFRVAWDEPEKKREAAADVTGDMWVVGDGVGRRPVALWRITEEPARSLQALRAETMGMRAGHEYKLEMEGWF